MPVIRIRDIDAYFEVHGEGQRVVLINGTGGDLRANPARGRGPLERNYQVLMYDERGLGRTTKPDVAYTMADYADDCVALMDAVGWDTAHVMGISFGGMLRSMWCFAIRNASNASCSRVPHPADQEVRHSIFSPCMICP
jgi:3-oxoadipate enol-lactonase